MDQPEFLDYVIGLVECDLDWFLDLNGLLLCLVLLELLDHTAVVLYLLEVDWDHWDQLVQVDILVGQESYQVRFLQRIKHDVVGPDQTLDHLHVHVGLFHFSLDYSLIEFEDSYSLGDLLDLDLDGGVPLDQILFALASYDPCPRIILQLKAILVEFIEFNAIWGWLLNSNPSTLQRDQIKVFFLGLFLVVE